MLGVEFFNKPSDFLTSLLKLYFTCDHFSQSYGGLKIAILANLGQLTRDIFRAINAFAEIQSVLEIVPNWLKEAYLPFIDLLQVVKSILLYFRWRVKG